jgi:hypothetical protein
MNVSSQYILNNEFNYAGEKSTYLLEYNAV